MKGYVKDDNGNLKLVPIPPNQVISKMQQQNKFKRFLTISYVCRNTKFRCYSFLIKDTVNILFGTNISSEEEMENWLETQRPKYDHEPRNGEEISLARVGKQLYEKACKAYLKTYSFLWNKIQG